MRGAVVAAAGALVLWLCGVSSGNAQVTDSVLRGRVVADESGRPVAGVQLRFDNGTRVLTDGRGRFEARLAPGEYAFALITSRCQVVFGRLDVDPGESSEVDLSLPEALATPAAPSASVLAAGTLLTAADIEAMHPRTLADVLRRVSPEMVAGPRGQPGQVSRLRGRTRATLSGRSTPIVFLDGVWLGGNARILQDVPPEDVAALQIVRGVNGGWVYGTGATGGVVRIWTKRGGRAPLAGSPDACEVPGFGGGAGE